MLKNSFVLFVGLILFSCGSGSDLKVNLETPQQYNDKIIGEQSKIMKIIIAMGDQNKTVEDVEKMRLELSAQCKESISTIEKMEGYDGDSKMKNAALKLFKFYLNSSDNLYKEMLEIVKKGEAITEADMARLTEIQTLMTEQEKPFDAEFQGAQKAFASKHNLMLMQNTLQSEIDNL